MSNYGKYEKGGKSRYGFGFRFKSWDDDARSGPWGGSVDSESDQAFMTRKDHLMDHDHVCKPVIIGSDGRATPGVIDCYDKQPQQKETMRINEETTYDDHHHVQKPVNVPYTKTGFGGMFQRPRPDYGTVPEPTLITDGGWVRPSPAGWKLPPEESLAKGGGQLEKVTNDIATAAESARTGTITNGNHWGPTGLYSQSGGKKMTATIDSREAVNKYGGQYI